MTATESRSEEQDAQVGQGEVLSIDALPAQRLSRRRTTATHGIPSVALANPRRTRLIDLRDASEVA